MLYSVSAGLIFASFVVWVFASVGADVVGRTAGPELFPTSYRATAAGVGALLGTVGGVLGPALEGALFNVFGSHWTPVCLIAASGLLMPLIVWVGYPETSGRSLEEVSPERVARRHV